MIIAINGSMGSGKDTAGSIIRSLLNTNKTFTGIYNNYVNPKNLFRIVKFADSLKDCVCAILKCSREDLENEKFKNTPLGDEWKIYKLHIMYHGSMQCLYKVFISEEDALNYYNAYKIKNGNFHITSVPMTPRKMLQLLGTECGRNIIHPNIWINATMSNYTPSSNWIITDLRFKNEYQSIRSKEHVLIRIERPIKLRYPDLYKAYGEPDNLIEIISEKHPDIYSKLMHQSETDLNHMLFNYYINNNGTLKELKFKLKEVLQMEHLL